MPEKWGFGVALQARTKSVRKSVFGYLGWGRLKLRIANTPILGIQNSFASRFGAEVCALGTPRQNPTFLRITQCKHPHTRYPKTRFLAHGVQRYGCLGRQPRTHNMFFGIVCFKRYHFRYLKTPLLAHSVQRYGCLGRHPRTHTIFIGTVRFKYYRFRSPNIPFLAHSAQRYGCLGRHPQNTHHIFWYAAFQTPPV